MKFSHFFVSIVAWQLLLGISADGRVLASISVQTEPCTLLKVEVQYKDGTSRTKWQCELSSADATRAGSPYVDVEGLSDEDLKNARSGVTSVLAKGALLANGQLTISAASMKEFGTTERSNPSSAAANLADDPNDMLERKLQSIYIDKRLVLAVRVVALDSQSNSSKTQIRNFTFGDGGDVSNLKERFQSCSYGETLMEPYNGTTLSGQTVIRGAYRLNVTLNAKGAPDMVVVNASLSMLTQLLGDIESQFDHVMLCLPTGTLKDGDPNWVSWAHYYSYLSVYNNDACNYPAIQMRGIGYNLGLDNSGEETRKFGDLTCMMGNPGYGLDTLNMCFNAAKSYQLGWYSSRRIALDFTQRTGFNGQLIGINDYKHETSAGKYVSIKILGSPFNRRDYYVGFNLATGINADTKEAPNRVTVYSKWGGSTPSALVGKLTAEQNFTVTNFDRRGNDLVINVKSISFTSLPSAEVDIYLTDCPPNTFTKECNSCTEKTDCPAADACAVASCDASNSCVYDTSKCDGNFILDMLTDEYPMDISWDVRDQCTGKVVLKGDTYLNSFPTRIRSSGILGQSRYTFTMRDKFGDGMGADYYIGGFNATFDGVLVSATTGDFGYEYSSIFGGVCAPK